VDVELNGTHTRGMTVGDFRPWVEHEDINDVMLATTLVPDALGK